MRRLQVTDGEEVRTLLKSESERIPGGALLHRLHCVTLVGAGLGCGEVAAAFGDDRRSVQRWVRRFENAGRDGLVDVARSGRPSRLTQAQIDELRLAVAQPPRSFDHDADAWSAEFLRLELERRFGIVHSRRHCVRLLDRLRRRAPLASRSSLAPDLLPSAGDGSIGSGEEAEEGI